MAAIRKLTLDNHTLVTHRRMPPAAARKFQKRVTQEITRIRADAAAHAEAGSPLDAILTDIAVGADAVGGARADVTPIDGMLQIDEALGRYPAVVDDPNWKPLR